MTRSLEELKKLDTAATPGPWKDRNPDGNSHVVHVYLDAAGRRCTKFIADCTSATDDNPANAEFIAVSRTAFPELAVEVERLTVELAACSGCLDLIHKAAEELEESLREAWSAPNDSRLYLFLTAFVGLIRAEVLKHPPKSGIVTSATFPDIGRMQIEIRRIEGKSAAEQLTEMQAEVERLTAENRALTERNAELDRLFELQYTRVGEATELWREATGQRDVLPDLGALVEWLMSEAKRWREAFASEAQIQHTKPAFETFVELKHGKVGEVLRLLQDGQISRGKAAEALAELAHGVQPRLSEGDGSPLPEGVVPSKLYAILTRSVEWWLTEGGEKFHGGPEWLCAARQILASNDVSPQKGNA